MARAESLSQNPGFAELHKLDPKAAEQLMVEAMQQDRASAGQPGQGEQGLLGKRGLSEEGTFEQETTPTPESL